MTINALCDNNVLTYGEPYATFVHKYLKIIEFAKGTD